MSESVVLPALGESVTEGTVTRWLKNVGDSVDVDEAQLDPMLLAYGGGSHSDIDPMALHHDGYEIGQPNAQEDGLDQHNLDNLLDLPHDGYHGWQSDPTMTSLEQESEFDKWMGE